MGVCTEERPVMHWQQSARFLGPGVREKSSSPPVAHQDGNRCGSAAGAKNNLLFRTCSSCPDICDHSTKSFNAAFSEPYKSYEPVDARSSYDESSLKHFTRSRTLCPDTSDETNSGISFKTEPYGPPSSPESTCEINLINHPNCAGCGQLIKDRFYLSAVEKRWHVNCLQCFACRQPLDGESSCYSREGNIYCKSDYYSFFGTRRCSRCLASISSSELVMRARNFVYHVNCFFCAVCHSPLTKGDHFGILDAVIYCRTHYSIALENDTTSSRSSFPYSTQADSANLLPDTNHIVPSGIFVPASQVISGLPQPPRQKGRPRKRKPKDIEALTANIDLNTEYLDFGRGSHISASSRTKRMRTSFKHHQLRTMKSYFAINHNPDAKDLKQLSQKTSLPKRVLQVWFQNARAKWRRMMLKQDGTNIMEKSDGCLDLDNLSTHSPTSFIIGGPSSSPSHNLE